MAGIATVLTFNRAIKLILARFFSEPFRGLSPSPEAVGPASRLRRRYADAPAAAWLTGLGTAAGLRTVRESADQGANRAPPATAIFRFPFRQSVMNLPDRRTPFCPEP